MDEHAFVKKDLKSVLKISPKTEIINEGQVKVLKQNTELRQSWNARQVKVLKQNRELRQSWNARQVGKLKY